jgi:hypothetical protein
VDTPVRTCCIKWHSTLTNWLYQHRQQPRRKRYPLLVGVLVPRMIHQGHDHSRKYIWSRRCTCLKQCSCELMNESILYWLATPIEADLTLAAGLLSRMCLNEFDKWACLHPTAHYFHCFSLLWRDVSPRLRELKRSWDPTGMILWLKSNKIWKSSATSASQLRVWRHQWKAMKLTPVKQGVFFTRCTRVGGY